MIQQRPRSERVIINSPMSFAGSAQRSWRLRGKWDGNKPLRIVLTPLPVLIIIVWWTLIVAWYAVTIGLLWFIMIPYRILRRGARKRKAEALRHRELLEAVNRKP